MSRAPASASWDALGETFYRRVELYTMQWHVADLSDYIVAGSKWGGPVGELWICLRWHAWLTSFIRD